MHANFDLDEREFQLEELKKINEDSTCPGKRSCCTFILSILGILLNSVRIAALYVELNLTFWVFFENWRITPAIVGEKNFLTLNMVSRDDQLLVFGEFCVIFGKIAIENR